MPNNAKDWFQDSAFWETYAPIMFDDAHWAEVDAVADGVTRLACLKLYENENRRAAVPQCEANFKLKLLDICCGPGRLSTEFARRGFSVTGIDITESYLKTAREDAEHEKLQIEYINSDSREYIKKDYFDVAVNLYNSFGFFDDPKDDLRLVKNAYQSLKKGGCFIIETFGKELAVRDFTEGEWFERAGFKVLTKYKVIDSWDRMENTWILIGEGTKGTEGTEGTIEIKKTFTQRLYCATELRALLMEAGFEKVEIYGNWDEAPYDIDANRLIIVGRK